MEQRTSPSEFIPLADMHTDGVRFDPDMLAAIRNTNRADRKELIQNQES